MDVPRLGARHDPVRRAGRTGRAGFRLRPAPEEQPELTPEETEDIEELAEETEAEELADDEPAPAVVAEEEALQELRDERNRLRMELHFERAFQWIYGSQMGFLMHLASSPEQTGGFTDINLWYGKHKEQAGDNALTMDKWLSYLEGNAFIQVDRTEGLLTFPQSARLTMTGEAFVRYCQNRGYRYSLRTN